MNMTTSDLIVNVRSILGTEPPRVPAEQRKDGLWVVSDLSDVVPLIPGDVVRAENGVITELVQASNLGAIAAYPAVPERLKFQYAASRSDPEVRATLYRLLAEMAPLSRFLIFNGTGLVAVPYNGDVVKQLDNSPHVDCVAVVRFPNGLVYERPFALTGPLVPITFEWVERHVRGEGGDAPWIWERMGQAPDTVPEDWA